MPKSRLPWILTLFTLSLWLPAFSAHAGPLYALDFQRKTLYYADPPAADEAVKDRFISEGKDYLRSYMRENVQRWMADNGFVWSDSGMEMASMNLASMVETAAGDQRWQARLRMLASDDVQHYLTCGRFVPLKLEMESGYRLLPGLQLDARVHAPLDSQMQVEVGGRIHCSEEIQTQVRYLFQSDNPVYSGLEMGVGVDWMRWHMEFNYRLNADLGGLQRLSIGRSF